MKNKVTAGTVWQVKQGTNLFSGWGTNSRGQKKLYPGNLFRTEQTPSGKSSRGTNSPGNKFLLFPPPAEVYYNNTQLDSALGRARVNIFQNRVDASRLVDLKNIPLVAGYYPILSVDCATV